MNSQRAHDKAMAHIGGIKGCYKHLDQVHDLPHLDSIIAHLEKLTAFYYKERDFLRRIEKRREQANWQPVEIMWDHCP